jgi:tripartite-type tricarboxylate transporter receptor subunit TctC
MAEEPGWHGIFAPAGTPKAVADKIAADVRTAVMSVELSTKFKEMEFQPSGLSGDAFAEVVKKDFDKWSKLIRENNIRGE